MGIKTVCILGGSGFIGRYIIHRLTNRGYQVIVPTRHPERHRDLRTLPLVTLTQHNIHEPVELDRLFKQSDAVINLVGILNEKGFSGAGFRHAHIELARKVISACEKNQVTRLLHMSALHANAANAPSHYLRSKGEAENLVHTFSKNVHVTSFRPSIVFGREDGFFNLFARILAFTPLVFPLVKANAKFQPVYVGDVADRFVAALENKHTYRQRYDLCGPRVYSFKELVSYTGKVSGHPRWILPLPDFIGRLQALLLNLMPGKPMTIDNFKSLSVDSVCKQACTLCTTTLESTVPQYLSNKNAQARYQNYRKSARR